MRHLCVSVPRAAIESMQEPRNLDLLMGSPLHLTQVPFYNLALVERAGGPKKLSLGIGMTMILGRNLQLLFERKP